MKTIRTTIVSVLFLLLRTPCPADPMVTIGDESFAVSFGDSSLTENDRTRIAADLTSIFAVFSCIGDVFDTNSVSGPFVLRDKSPFVYPESFQPEPSAGLTNGILFLSVASGLSTRYREAFAFVETNQEAFASLPPFIEELRSGSVTNRNHESRRALICRPDGSSPDLTEAESFNVAGSLFVTQPGQPSVLDAGYLTIGGVPCLSSASKFPDMENGEPDASAIVWVFHNGLWKWYCP